MPDYDQSKKTGYYKDIVKDGGKKDIEAWNKLSEKQKELIYSYYSTGKLKHGKIRGIAALLKLIRPTLKNRRINKW